MVAAIKGHTAIVEALLSAGAKLETPGVRLLSGCYRPIAMLKPPYTYAF